MENIGWHLLTPFLVGAGIGVVIIAITFIVLGWNEERKFRKARASALLRREQMAAITREMERGGYLSNSNEITLSPGKDGLIREVLVPFGNHEFRLTLDDGLSKDQIRELTINLGRGMGLTDLLNDEVHRQRVIWDHWR